MKVIPSFTINVPDEGDSENTIVLTKVGIYILWIGI
jgi:hypothetical protein